MTKRNKIPLLLFFLRRNIIHDFTAKSARITVSISRGTSHPSKKARQRNCTSGCALEGTYSKRISNIRN